MIIPFSEIKDDQQFVGSKAYVLAILFSKGLPVPNGLILSHNPETSEDWNTVRSWWTSIGMPLLAVRSSAFGEDSKEMSFAGQNQSFLNVKNFEELQHAINKCFASVDRESSKSYRKFFTGSDKAVPMNVVLQEMVDAKYSGVYFSENPLNSSDAAMLEYIEGYGEALVSGQKNPFRVFENKIQEDSLINKAGLKSVFQLGHQVEEALQEKVDMEWAIDQHNKLFMLQARPITASRSLSQNKKIIEKEFSRIEKEFAPETCWDGQTFCEWTGNPSQLSFEVWKKAFASGGALDLALHELGYLGFNKKQEFLHESILDQVFGRAFVNMSKMLPLYFGPIPYEFVATPRPQMKFTSKNITWEGIFKTPVSMYRMFEVGWSLTTKRRVWIDKARKELIEFRVKMQRPSQSEIYADWSSEKLVERWEKEITNFSKFSLKWPLVIAVLIEATYQSLQTIVKSALGKERADELLREWMGAGLSTATFEMNASFKKAQEDLLKRDFFFSRYGHRGPGELDLSHPRWQELGDAAFRGSVQKNAKELEHAAPKVEAFILGLNTFKKNIILDEWRLLKELLELREQWKMEILRG